MTDNAKPAFVGTSKAPCSPRFIPKCGMAKWMVIDTLNTQRVIAECARWDDASWIAKALDAYEANAVLSGNGEREKTHE